MKKALLLVDIQNDYFPGGAMEVEGSTEAAVQAARLLRKFREKGLPVIHVQHLAIRPGSTFFLPDTRGAEIHAAVAPVSGETLFQKHYPNSFRETPLLEYLKKEEIEQLVIAGMMTHMCIDTTTRAAADLGYQCLLAHDACAAPSLTFGGNTVPASDVHLAFISALNGLFARALTVEEITLILNL